MEAENVAGPSGFQRQQLKRKRIDNSRTFRRTQSKNTKAIVNELTLDNWNTQTQDQNPTNSNFYSLNVSDSSDDNSSEIRPNIPSVYSSDSSFFDGNSTDTSNFSLSDPSLPSLKDELIFWSKNTTLLIVQPLIFFMF